MPGRLYIATGNRRCHGPALSGKKDLLIDGQGKYHGYNYYKVAGLAIGGKGKGEAQNENPPVDIKSLIP